MLAGYRILGVLGRGGMGIVYRAQDTRLDRQVALKVLSSEVAADPVFRERFLRESRMLASVEHHNIVSVFHADQAEGLYYLAMRLVDGADLGGLLRAEGRLEPTAVAHIVEQVAEALDAAHAHGLVHRDVKPGNILIDASGEPLERARVYLTDFGLTKRSDAPPELTVTGQFLGTVDYVAPEQIQGSEIDGRADLYALACVAFECLAGQPPFHGAREAAALMAHLVTKPPRLSELRPELPSAVSSVLARGMAKNRDRRPASCAQFATELRQAISGGPLPLVLAGIESAAEWHAPEREWPASAVEQPATQSIALGSPTTSGAPPRARNPWLERGRPGRPVPHARSRGSSWNTLLNVLGGMLAVFVLALLVFIALNMFDWPGQPADGQQLAEQQLRGHIPSDIRPSCQTTQGPANAQASVACSAEGGTVELHYTLYGDDEQLAAAYQALRQEWGVVADIGEQGSRCADPARWPNEGQWTFNNQPTGRLMCRKGGRPEMSWTDLRSNVLTRAIDHAQDGRRVYLFWRDGRFPAAPGDSPAAQPTPIAVSPPPTGSEEDTELLRGHIPRRLRPFCEADIVQDPVLAAQVCSAENGSIEVRYALYPDVDQMEDAYRLVRRELGVTPNSGQQGARCQAAGDWPHEGPYTFGNLTVGRLLCVEVDDRPRFDWTDERFRVLSRAIDHGGDAARLFEFWKSRAGPVE